VIYRELIAFLDFTLPSILVVAAVLTLDSSNDTIEAALEVYWLVKVVHKMVCPNTVPTMVTNWRRVTPKVVDAIFLAVSVLTTPMIQKVAFEKHYNQYICNVINRCVVIGQWVCRCRVGG